MILVLGNKQLVWGYDWQLSNQLSQLHIAEKQKIYILKWCSVGEQVNIVLTAHWTH